MYGIYYNELFDSLIISANDGDIKNIELNDKGITLVNSDKGIDGINIFNVAKDIHISDAFNSFNEEVIKYIQKRLDGVYDFKQEKQFVVGKVMECDEIEGTHLHLCKINIGDEVLQIVCGAKNIAKDQLVVVAKVGAWMPNGMQILPGKLRGHESFGMVCSAKELSIKNNIYNEEGIIVLPEVFNNKVGEDFFKEHNNK